MFRRKGENLSERQQRIYDFLSNNCVGVLTTVDPNGEPHGAVIYYTVDKDFAVSFLTKSGTKKYDNLKKHGRAMLVIFEPASQTVAQVLGQAVEIKDGYDINNVAAAVFMTSLKTSEGGIPPIAKLQAGEYTAFRIEPKQIRLASYTRPDSDDYANLFESIESFELTRNES